MEHNGGNQNLPPPSLCRSGCGFYGSESFEGMCSKCYKDQLKRKNQNPSPSPVTGRNSPSVNSFVESSSSSSSFTTASTTTATPSSSSSTPTTPSVETATPTVPTPLSQSQKANEEKTEPEGATGGAEASPCCDSDSSELSDKDKKPKKNRCHTCKKKVGLTGFSCRCGGLYCSLHRYSDKHECTFNYKELGQAQIRKQNPVVVSSKIQKI